MDFRPSEVLRMLQLELPQHEKKLLTSKAIWMCVGCETCYSRCPKKVDLPRVMDFLREAALAEGLAHKEATDIQAFHRAFLNSIAGHGRVYEFGMIADFKRRTGRLFQDVTLGAPMMMKGKISLVPHSTKDKKAVARIMARSAAKAKSRKEARS
jgi:heterodisulfide reductase subunit C